MNYYEQKQTSDITFMNKTDTIMSPTQHSPSFLLCLQQHHTLSLSEEEHSSSPTTTTTTTVDEDQNESANNHLSFLKSLSLPLNLTDNDLFLEHQELLSLISKQRPTHLCSNTDGPLVHAPRRYDAVTWISKVSVTYGFTALTTVLAVNYFDRFITSIRFEMDKAWMTQLTAVACLSLAAKMEETQVPLLLDLQVEESRFVFKAKTIQRMELLVMSTLNWRMSPVTPISFFEHIVRRLGLKNPLLLEFLWRCERVLLSVIVDLRVMSFLPSILAAATMIHVIKEIDPLTEMECRTQLLALLKISEEQVNECHKLILKLLFCHESVHNLSRKRKCLSGPSSSSNVMDATFICDSSNDSWTATSSVLPEPAFKRSKTQEQRIRLPPVTRVSVDVLNSPS